MKNQIILVNKRRNFFRIIEFKINYHLIILVAANVPSEVEPTHIEIVYNQLPVILRL
jgi:hypothetical protein